MEQETSVVFWGGLDTIGGNIVSFTHGKHRIITDFGALVGASIEELLDKNNAADLFNRELLPKIDGIYTEDQVKHLPIQSMHDSSMKTIICLSHLHLDHLGSFNQLDESIPVYALNDAVTFYKELSQHGHLPVYHVNWQSVNPEEIIEFGPFTIQFHESDHDTIGAASIFIQAPDLKVVYSGDFRLSGQHPERVTTWAKKANEWQPDLFLVEGTTFSFGQKEPSEQDLYLQSLMANVSAPTERKLAQTVNRLLQEHSSELFAFNGYPQNMERFLVLATVARQNHRYLVLDKGYYDLFKAVGYDTSLVKCLYQDVTLDELKEQPGDYILQVDNSTYSTLFELPAGIYLHSNGMPLGSYDPTYQPFVEAIVNHQWKFYLASVSGHASQSDLLCINYLVNSPVTVPWHTFQPHVYAQALEDIGLHTWQPERYVEYRSSTILSMKKGV